MAVTLVSAAVSEPSDLLHDLLGAPPEHLRRLSGGASRETWSFDCAGRPLILRRDPPGAAKSGMAVEARLFQAAARAGVPVPEVVAAGDQFIVMERIEGETIPRKILRDDDYADARPKLASQCGAVLAALHRMPVEEFADLPDTDPLAEYRAVLDASGQAHPAFELGFTWLEANRPPRTGTTIVHGDFRHGNLVIGPDGLRAVLDWELAHRGDPVEDLGWLCVKAWRFGVADKPVGGFGDYDELTAAYEAAGGVRVDPDALRWWEALGTLKWGVICIMQGMAHTSGAVRSVELAAIGRRVCENEWDLLHLLPFGGSR
jgi:aminoglycoside phosphotransferase (APT) family kinase protein